MARNKIDYGIDLGTTNSAICRMEKGVPVIKKIEVTDDIMPSCVYFNRRGGLTVGKNAYNSMKSDKKSATKTWKIGCTNTYIEFKRTMGTNEVYHSSNCEKNNMKADYTSEDLSAEVLKGLKKYVADETVKSVVITVPAKFEAAQKKATMEAARLAGFDHCELLQEPIAASMAYGMASGEKDGYWLVFDFGGGTFDAALLKVEDGIMQVFDTEGDNYLGGKNLDYAIVDEILIPYLKENFVIDDIMADPVRKEILRDAMKTYAEEAKNALSFENHYDVLTNLGELGCDDEGTEFEIDLTITQQQAFDAMRPYFQKAVNICKDLLARNNMQGSKLSKVILVGGPTHLPLIRQMLREQISENVDTSIDPMTVVATGAALYASTLNAEVDETEIEQNTIRLKVDYEATTVETELYIPFILDKAATGSGCPDKVYVELVSSDNTWSSGKAEINEAGDVIRVALKEGRTNCFVINTYDDKGNRLECFPSEITINQGTKVGAAPLPYFVGAALWDEEKKKSVFVGFDGLEKNKPLPATGTLNDMKTTHALRPGMAEDKVNIPILQADERYDGTSSKFCHIAGSVEITGLDVNELIPEGSLVDITVKADSSEMFTVEVLFKKSDFTVEKEARIDKHDWDKDAQLIDGYFDDTNRTLSKLEQEGVNTSALRAELDKIKTDNQNGAQTGQTVNNLKEILRKVEQLDNSSEYERVEKKLKRMLKEAEDDCAKYGGFEDKGTLEELTQLANEAISRKDVKMAKEAYDQLDAFDYKIAQIEYFVSWIYSWNRRFDTIRWNDVSRARQLVNQALGIINDNPTVDRLHPYVRQLIDLLPQTEVPQDAAGLLKK